MAPDPARHRDAAAMSCETLPSAPELGTGPSRSSQVLGAARGEGSPRAGMFWAVQTVFRE